LKVLPEHPLFRRFENELVVPLRDEGILKIEWTIKGKNFFLRLHGKEVGLVWAILG